MTNQLTISNAGNLLVNVCHGASKAAGWWSDIRTGQPIEPAGDGVICPNRLETLAAHQATKEQSK